MRTGGCGVHENHILIHAQPNQHIAHDDSFRRGFIAALPAADNNRHFLLAVRFRRLFEPPLQLQRRRTVGFDLRAQHEHGFVVLARRGDVRFLPADHQHDADIGNCAQQNQHQQDFQQSFYSSCHSIPFHQRRCLWTPAGALPLHPFARLG